MLGFLPFSQFLFAEEQSERGLSELVPKQMPCPPVWDITPLRGDQVRELGLWSQWLFYWKPREKGWAPINTHVIPETHFAMHTHTSKPFRVLGSEWMGANGAACRPRKPIEIKSSGARGATRQHTVNPANGAFKVYRKVLISVRALHDGSVLHLQKKKKSLMSLINKFTPFSCIFCPCHSAPATLCSIYQDWNDINQTGCGFNYKISKFNRMSHLQKPKYY